MVEGEHDGVLLLEYVENDAVMSATRAMPAPPSAGSIDRNGAPMAGRSIMRSARWRWTIARRGLAASGRAEAGAAAALLDRPP
jgi:hypothetical protein